MVDSRKKKRVDGELYYIQSYKRTYLYWFKFLQECGQDPSRKVDWSKYELWGGKEEVMNTNFDTWWKTHWVELFGIKSTKEKPRVELSTRSPVNEGLRFSWLCHIHRDLDKLEIWKKINQIEEKRLKRRVKFKDQIKGTFIEKTTEGDQEIRSRVGRYIKYSDEVLDSICIGIFPPDYLNPIKREREKPTEQQIKDFLKLEEKEIQMCTDWYWSTTRTLRWLIEHREWSFYGNLNYSLDTLPDVQDLYPQLLVKSKRTRKELRKRSSIEFSGMSSSIIVPPEFEYS